MWKPSLRIRCATAAALTELPPNSEKRASRGAEDASCSVLVTWRERLDSALLLLGVAVRCERGAAGKMAPKVVDEAGTASPNRAVELDAFRPGNSQGSPVELINASFVRAGFLSVAMSARVLAVEARALSRTRRSAGIARLSAGRSSLPDWRNGIPARRMKRDGTS
eukprot:2046799-Pleurochrysis_carterae.AAC.1